MSRSPADGDFFGSDGVVHFETVWSGNQSKELWVRSVLVTRNVDGAYKCLDLLRDGSGLATRSIHLNAGLEFTVRSYSRPKCVEGRYMAGSVGTITPYKQTWREPDGNETWMVHAGAVPSWVR